MNCFNCEMERICDTSLDLITQKKAFSTDTTMLERKPAIEYHQMLLYHISECEPRQNNTVFESAKEVLGETGKNG